MPKWPPETILLVDDNEIDLRLHKRVLKRAGFTGEVVTCTSGEAAIEWMRAPGCCPVDLILLDINMPRMDGFEMLQAAEAEFSDHFRECAVIMLSTSLDPGDRTRAQEIPVIRQYFDKPLTPERVTWLLTAGDATEAVD